VADVRGIVGQAEILRSLLILVDVNTCRSVVRRVRRLARRRSTKAAVNLAELEGHVL